MTDDGVYDILCVKEDKKDKTFQTVLCVSPVHQQKLNIINL